MHDFLYCFQRGPWGVRESDEVPTGAGVCRDLSNHVGPLTKGITVMFIAFHSILSHSRESTFTSYLLMFLLLIYMNKTKYQGFVYWNDFFLGMVWWESLMIWHSIYPMQNFCPCFAFKKNDWICNCYLGVTNSTLSRIKNLFLMYEINS